MRGAPRERRVFPAGAFLYRSGTRHVLFDTGYAPEPWRAGLGGWAYRRATTRAELDDALTARERLLLVHVPLEP